MNCRVSSKRCLLRAFHHSEEEQQHREEVSRHVITYGKKDNWRNCFEQHHPNIMVTKRALNPMNEKKMFDRFVISDHYNVIISSCVFLHDTIGFYIEYNLDQFSFSHSILEQF